MEFLKNYKILLILLFLLFIILFFNSTCYGAAAENVDSKYVELLDNCNNWLENNGYSSYTYYVMTRSFVWFVSEPDNFWLNDSGQYNAYYSSVNAIMFSHSDSNNYYSVDISNVNSNNIIYYFYYENSPVIYNNYDVKFGRYSNNVAWAENYIFINNFEPCFHLEQDEETGIYYIYSNWYYESTEVTGIPGYFNQNYFVVDPIYSPVSFDVNYLDGLGWELMSGADDYDGIYISNYDEVYDENDVAGSVLRLQFCNRITCLDYGKYFCCYYNVDTQFYQIECFDIRNDGHSSYTVLNNNTGIYEVKDSSIDNEIKNNDYSNFNYYGTSNIENFSVSYNNEEEEIFVYTNYFKINNDYDYKCSWSLDNKNWFDMIYSDYNNYFRYVLDVFENGVYYFKCDVLDKNDNNKIINTKIIYYNLKVGDVHNITDMVNRNYGYRFFKKSLGPMFYPIDLLFEFFDRLYNIDVVDAEINIPTLIEPITNTTLINGFTFSLTDVLQNNGVNSAYNYYLLFSDFIIYGWCLRFLYKVLREFMNVDGGVL